MQSKILNGKAVATAIENDVRNKVFDFKNNLKLTYDFELQYAEYMMDYLRGKKIEGNLKIYDKSQFVTEGIRYFLLRLYPEQTDAWLGKIASEYSRLANQWGLKSFIPSQTSRYGLVLFAESETYGDVVVKFIPDFVDRFETEIASYQELSPDYMCEFLGCDYAARAMLLRRVSPAKYADFNDNILLTEFFDKVDKTIRPVKAVHAPERFLDYYADLRQKLTDIETVPFFRERIKEHLQAAIAMYDQYFSDSPLYLCHGDLHAFNIIQGQDGYVAVDPLGVRAPRELEYVRFIRNDILNIRSFGMRERLNLLLSYFSRWAGKKSLLLFLYIDTVYVTFNCTFEHPDDGPTGYNLKLLNVIRQMIDLDLMN